MLNATATLPLQAPSLFRQACPVGGVKASGLGRKGSEYGLDVKALAPGGAGK